MSSGKTWSCTMFTLDVVIIALLVWAAKLTVGLQACTKFKERCSASSEFIGSYTFPTTPIKKFDCKSEEAIAEMKKGMPIVLKNCQFGEVTQSWTIDYLKENLISPNLTVYKSPTRRFLFYNRENAKDFKIEVQNMSWNPPHNVTEMNFSQFLDEMAELETARNGTKTYLQTGLENKLLKSDMQDDVLMMFNAPRLKEIKEKLSWGRLDVNLFLLGMGGVVTPAHYDIMENLFLQIYGKKRCILFSPENYKFLYPYPTYHPHDRQTQVNFDYPDFEKFPKFRNITGVDAIVGPGDVLYIPNYWWHYIESQRDSTTISMNFWYMPEGAEDESSVETTEEQDEMSKNEHGVKDEEKSIKMEGREKKLQDGESSRLKDNNSNLNETESVPYSAGELIGLSRDIEAMVGDALGDVTKVGEFLKEMVEGRYDFV